MQSVSNGITVIYMKNNHDTNGEQTMNTEEMMRIADSIFVTATCQECERTFNLMNDDERDEWTFGHDCED